MAEKPKEPTQRQYILGHLLRYGTIEPLTALREYGCYRLSQIIKILRDEGYNITTKKMDGYSKITGRKVQYALYCLNKDGAVQ